MKLDSSSKIICFDFETSGDENQYPTEIAWVEINTKGEILSYYETLLDKATTLESLWPIMSKTFTDDIILCGHNVGFDRNILLRHLPFLGNLSYIDTLQLFKQLYQEQISDYSLSSLLQQFNLEEKVYQKKCNNHFNPHRALFDAVGCATLLTYLLLDPEINKIFKQPIQTLLL